VPVSWFLVADCVIQGVHAEATYNKGSGMFRFYCNLILFVMFPDFRHDKMARQHARMPAARFVRSGGESENTSFGCRSLLEEKAISILQFDATMYGGFTEGRKLAALCELNHVQVAPHHDCFIHAQLVASSPAGLIVEAFTDPERDPLQAELYEDAPEIKDGIIKLSDAPGLGLTLNENAIEKYGTRIL
jgi:D-galactarolactone cycloisomerase